jgi:hypothetical protein
MYTVFNISLTFKTCRLHLYRKGDTRLGVDCLDACIAHISIRMKLFMAHLTKKKTHFCEHKPIIKAKVKQNKTVILI